MMGHCEAGPDLIVSCYLTINTPNLTIDTPHTHQDSKGYQPNTEEQVTVRLGTNPYIKAGRSNSVEGKEHKSLTTQTMFASLGPGYQI